MINVVDDRSARAVSAVAASLGESYPRTWALGDRAGNTVLVASVAALDHARIAAQAAADPDPARLIASAAMTRLAAAIPAPRDEEL